MKSIKSFFLFFWHDNYMLVYLALIKLLIHFISNGFFNYGFFRDEFYYIACSDHLALGYVDQPPFSIFLLAISRFLFGHSLFAIRLFPAIAGAITVFMTGLITRKLGGNRFAQAMAAVAVIIAPIFLALNTFYSMNAFDILFWTIGLYLIVLIIKNDKRKHWLLLGFVIGLGLLNKISIIWFCGGLVVGLLLTGHRKKLLTPGPWLALLTATVLFLPHIIWQIVNDFPTLEFIRNATIEKMTSVPFVQFLMNQVDMVHPILLPLWFAGLLFFLVKKEGSRFRWFGFMYLSIFLFLMLSRTSRAEYLAPSYTILFAGGSVFFETLTSRVRRWLRPIYLSLVIGGGIIAVPMSLPVLPVENFIHYTEFLGKKPSTAERKELGKLGQFYADMHGWEKMVETIAHAYQSLSPEEQSRCLIFTGNYGEAGAIDFFGKKYHLPPAICGHNNYSLWGPGDTPAQVIIFFGGPSEKTLKSLFKDVKKSSTFTCKYCMPYENMTPIFVCKDPIVDIKKMWPRFKHYD